MRKYLAELIGTFILVLIGTMSIVGMANTEGPLLAIVPWGFGLGLLAAIFAVGHISGGHFNPAVTIAMLVTKRMPTSDAVGYFIGQFAGATLASTVLLAMSDQDSVAGTANSFGSNGAATGLVSEVVLTMIFLLVILMVTKTVPAAAAFAISLTLVVIHVAGIWFSGASVNPARSFGPAVVGANVGELWVYLVGPVVGALLAVGLYNTLGAGEES